MESTIEDIRAIQDILTEEKKCPMCNVHNLTWDELQEIERLTQVSIPSMDVRGATYDLGILDFMDVDYEPTRVTHGTACWDSAFGDTCGSCLQPIVHRDLALVGANGMCHEVFEEEF